MKLCLAWLMVASAARAAAPSAAAPEAADAVPKPYTLFMGADFALHAGDGYYRVLNVVGSSFVIRENGRFVHIHPGTLPISIQVKRSLKLMPGSAELKRFSWERDYMEGTNPEEKAATAYANLVGYAQDQLSQATAAMRGGQWAMNTNLSNGVVPTMSTANGPSLTPTPGAGASAQQIAQAYAQNSSVVNALNGENISNQMVMEQEDTFTTNAYNHAQQDAAASDGRNAIHIKFDLQTPVLLRKPYAMFVALIHAPGHEHQKQQWIGGTEIDSVAPGHPVHVDFFQGGFPAGYRVDRLSVYIYDDGGREVGTNQSNDRVALTRDQAFEYLVIEYLSDHRNSTLPATPAMTKLPADWRAHAHDAWFRQTYYVKVDKNGHAEGIFTDPDCRQPANAYLSAMITGVWFRPALHEGKPVETVAQVVPQTLVD